MELNRCDKPIGKLATPKWIFPELGDVDPEAPKAERLKQLAKLMTHSENGRFTRTIVNRIWQRLMGRGIVHPVDSMHTKPFSEDLLDYLAVRFAEDNYDLKRFIQFVMTSQAYQSRSVVVSKELGDDYAYAGPIARRMTAEQLLDSIWQITGTEPARADASVDRSTRSDVDDADSQPVKLDPASITASWIWHAGEAGKRTQLRKVFRLNAASSAAILSATCDNAFVMKINGRQVAQSHEWTKPVYSIVHQYLQTGENIIEVDAETNGGSAGFICQLSVMAGDDRIEIASDMSWDARPPGSNEWEAASVLKPHGAKPWGDTLKTDAGFGFPPGPTPPVRAALVENDFLMRSLGRPNRDLVVTTRPSDLTTLQAIDLANGEVLADYLHRGAVNLVADEQSAQRIIRLAVL